MVNLELLSQPSVFQLARAGDFQAIAYWLNTYLVPQDIYARVAVDRPGWLLVLVEFCQSPNRNRLNRFVCHRLCRLNSEVIQGVRIIARPLGSPNIWWDQSIRLAVEPKRSVRPIRAPHGLRRTVQIRPSTPPSTGSRSLRSRRRSPSALTLTTRPTVSPAMVESIQTLTESARALTASLVESTRHLSPAQVTTLGKAAAAVFLVSFGVGIAGRMSLWDDSSGRPKSVQTASGKVSVIQASPVTNANDPTVTLTFSSDPAVNLTSIGSMAQVMPANDLGSQTTGWPDSENIDGTLGTESPDLGSLNGFEQETENATVNAIANLPGESPFTVASDAIARSSDVLMTNLNRPVNDAQFLLSASLEKNLDSATTGLERSLSDSVTVVNLSGEPLMQDGSTGLVKTLDALEKAGMYAVGAGRNRHEARRPEIIDVRGKRIAYLGYADSDVHAANRWQAGTNPALKDQVEEDIRAIRDQVDWVIVNYHWSQDLASFPADWQMTIAHHAIDQGADLVVGYHPNVLQGAEIYKGRAIAYSLGDFVFQDGGQAVNASAVDASGNVSSNNASSNDKPTAAPVKAQSDTAMLKVSIKDDQMKLEFLPVQIQNAQPAIAQGQKQTEILRYLGQASALFETPLRSPAILNRLHHTNTPNAAPSNAPAAAPVETSPSFVDESIPALDNRPSPENAPDSFINYPKPSVTAPASPTPPTVRNVKPSSEAFVEPQAALLTSTYGSTTKQPAGKPPDSQGTLQAASVDLSPNAAAPAATKPKVAPIPALLDSVAQAIAENVAHLANEAVSSHPVSGGETAVENPGANE